MGLCRHPPVPRSKKKRSEDFGWAKFKGFAESVFVHRADVVDQLPKRGDALFGRVVRKRNGKLQAYDVRRTPVEDADDMLHAKLLGGVVTV